MAIIDSRAFTLLALIAGLVLPARGADPGVVAMGKERAAASRLQWQPGESNHPVLGPIRFATLRTPLTTPVGTNSVSSQIYVSCERNTRRIAIEVANATSPDDPGGLQPRSLPRLMCNRLAGGDRKLVQDELDVRWAVNAIGDALAQGLGTGRLRDCVSINVIQEVALPKSWAREAARVDTEIPTYGRELDAIFASCGEISAYPATPSFGPPPAVARAPSPPPVAQAPPPAATSAPPPKPVPQPPPQPAPAATASLSWEMARVVASGKTNVRARPGTDAPVVVQLDPGQPILVQRAGGEWYRAKSRTPGGFEGYIRQDRLQR